MAGLEDYRGLDEDQQRLRSEMAAEEMLRAAGVGVPEREPVSDADVAEFERLYGPPLPPDGEG